MSILQNTVWMYTLVFTIGLFIGSFLNVVVLRRGTGLSIVSGRSKCLSCGKTLHWYELLPLISYVFQLGKCTKCKTPISWQYPLVEFLSGISFLLLYSLYIAGIFNFYYFLLYIVIFSLLLVIVAYDIRHKIIPDEWSLLLAILTAIIAWGRFSTDIYTDVYKQYLDLLAGPMWFLPFYFLWKYSDGRWIGLGDGKLAIGLAFLLGFAESFSAIALAFWLGAAWAGIIFIFNKVAKVLKLKWGGYQLTMKTEVPFAPFMILATLIVFVTHIDIFSLHAFGL